MILNDLRSDVKELMRIEGMTQQEAADKLEQNRTTLNRAMRLGPPHTQLWWRLVDLLGYDVEFVFHKRQ